MSSLLYQTSPVIENDFVMIQKDLPPTKPNRELQNTPPFIENDSKPFLFQQPKKCSCLTDT